MRGALFVKWFIDKYFKNKQKRMHLFAIKNINEVICQICMFECECNVHIPLHSCSNILDHTSRNNIRLADDTLCMCVLISTTNEMLIDVLFVMCRICKLTMKCCTVFSSKIKCWCYILYLLNDFNNIINKFVQWTN